MRKRNLSETGLPRQLSHRDLMRGVHMTVDQRHRDGVDPCGPGAGQCRHDRRCVQCPDFDAICVKPAGDFEHLFIKKIRAPDVQIEQLWPRLSADAQEVGKPLGDQQCNPLALAFQKRVGRNGCAHLDG